MKLIHILILAGLFLCPDPSMRGRTLQGMPKLSLAIADAKGVRLLRFDAQSERFKEVRKEAIHSSHHLAVDSQFIYAATIDTLYRWDLALQTRREKLLGEIGALAAYDGCLLVSAAGYLAAIDRDFNPIGRAPMVRNYEGKLKNVHDILVYGRVAYMLDDIVMPVYVLKVDLSDLRNMKVVEQLQIYCSPANSSPHLMGQWLDIENDRWVLISSSSTYVSMGGRGGPSQKLLLLSAVAVNMGDDPIRWPGDYDFEHSSEETVTLFASRPDYGRRTPLANVGNEEGIWLLKCAANSPTWLAFTREKHLFVGNGRIAERPADSKGRLREKYMLKIDREVQVDAGGYNAGSQIVLKKYKDWLILAADRTLKIYDIANKPKEIFSQELEEAANDIFVFAR